MEKSHVSQSPDQVDFTLIGYVLDVEIRQLKNPSLSMIREEILILK